jgi:divalent metal cation (Fe/Co/Zn/Cd) transporter
MQSSHQNDNHINKHSINQERFHRLRRIAFWSCIISFIFDIGLGSTAFINCIRTKSFVGFSYAVHTFMDSLCTSFVSWHLIATSINDVHRRDILACCVIGALFIGSFLAIETRAIQSMMSPPTVRPDLTVVIYSYIHITVFTILSIIKIRISKEIRSIALKFDTLNSIIGIIMVLPLLVWDRVVFIKQFTHLDDLVQVFMALFLFVAGGKLILDSITIMNTEYARKIREEKLEKMLKDTGEDDFAGINGIHLIVGT